MILAEPIERVLKLQYAGRQPEPDDYLHLIGAFEYHVTDGRWMLFETEHHYVTIGCDGVQVYDKPHTFPAAVFWEWDREEDDVYLNHDAVLFKGQRIHKVEECRDHTVICFDDFRLDLYVYGNSDVFDVGRGAFGDGVSVMAVGGHLLRRCECGGAGELLVDERGDFAARCQRCHKATWVDMVLQGRIDAWNAGDAPCVIDTGREELQQWLKTKRIRYIALPSDDRSIEKCDDGCYWCANVIIAFEDAFFLLTSQKAGGDTDDFAGHELASYNRDCWSNVIQPVSGLSFLREEADCEGRKTLRFKLDDAELLIEAGHRELVVELDEVRLLLDGGAGKRRTLL